MAMQTIGSLMVQLGLDSAKFDKGIGRATRRANGFGKDMAAIAKVAGAAFAAFATGAGISSAIAKAEEFSKVMGEVSTLLNSGEQDIKAFEASAKAMARTFGGSASAQMGGFYKAVSAGANTIEDANAVMEAANKLAIGGATTVDNAIGGLMGSLNAYGAEFTRAEDVSDAFFVAMRNGQTTIGELAAGFGKLAPVAASAGLSLEESLAAISAVTTGGISTKEAITGLRQVLANIIKPSNMALGVAQSLGLQFNSTALESKGLAKFLEEVTRATRGNIDQMAQLFGSVEALVPVLALTGGQADNFAQNLVDMGNKAGSTQTAFDKMADSVAQRMEVLRGKLDVLFIEIGDVILRYALPALEKFADWFDANKQSIVDVLDSLASNMDKVGRAVQLLISYKVATWLIGIGKWAGPVIGGFTAIAGAVGAGTAAIGLFTAAWVGLKKLGLVGLVLTGVDALITLARETYNAKLAAEELAKAQEVVKNALAAGESAIDSQTGALNKNAEAAIKAAQAIVAAEQEKLNAMRATSERSFFGKPLKENKAILDLIDQQTRQLETSQNRLKQLINNVTGSMDVLGGSVNAATGEIKGLDGSIRNLRDKTVTITVRTVQQGGNTSMYSNTDAAYQTETTRTVTKPMTTGITADDSIKSSASGGTKTYGLPGGSSVTVYRATGGMVRGAGGPTSDSIPAMLSNGEFVVNAKSTRQNKALLEAINKSGKVKGFFQGGMVGTPFGGTQKAEYNKAGQPVVGANMYGIPSDTVMTDTVRGYLVQMKTLGQKLQYNLSQITSSNHPMHVFRDAARAQEYYLNHKYKLEMANLRNELMGAISIDRQYGASAVSMQDLGYGGTDYNGAGSRTVIENTFNVNGSVDNAAADRISDNFRRGVQDAIGEV